MTENLEEFCRCEYPLYHLCGLAVIPPKVHCNRCQLHANKEVIEWSVSMYEWGKRVGEGSVQHKIREALGIV